MSIDNKAFKQQLMRILDNYHAVAIDYQRKYNNFHLADLNVTKEYKKDLKSEIVKFLSKNFIGRIPVSFVSEFHAKCIPQIKNQFCYQFNNEITNKITKWIQKNGFIIFYKEDFINIDFPESLRKATRRYYIKQSQNYRTPEYQELIEAKNKYLDYITLLFRKNLLFFVKKSLSEHLTNYQEPISPRTLEKITKWGRLEFISKSRCEFFN